MRGKRFNLDERFTDIADEVSELMGKWWVSVVWAVAIVAWTIFCMVSQGAGWWYGTFYNLPLNLCTTVAELFIGFLLAAAANRSERHGKRQMERLDRMEREHGAELAAIRQEQTQLREINERQSEMLALLQRAVVKVDMGTQGTQEKGAKRGADRVEGVSVVAQPAEGRAKRRRADRGE